MSLDLDRPWRVLIVDDEQPARRTLRLLLESHPDCEIVAECDHGAAAVTAIQTAHPDVMFLDVEMPGMNGMEVLETVGPGAVPVVVFVTAYDQYAVQAFEAHALDYLLKPFSDERFAAVVTRVRRALKYRALGEAEQQLAGWLAEKSAERAARGMSAPRQLVVRDGALSYVYPLAEIDWIAAEDYCIRIHAGKQHALVRQSLRSVLGQLDPAMFVRIHRSAIVNVGKVRQVRPLPSGDSEVLLADGTVIRMSRKFRAAFDALFHG